MTLKNDPQSKKIIALISDLHIQSDKSPKIDLLQSFFESYQSQLKSFYILGDLFEAWIGDEQMQFFPRFMRILSDIGKTIPTFFIAGNRDFLLGRDFFHTTHIEPLADIYLLRAFGQDYHLSHGDLFCTLDQDYQNFRKMVHNPKWKNNFLAQSLTKRQEIAKSLRLISQENNQNKNEAIMDVNEAEIRKTLKTYQCPIIHGHTHQKAIHRISLASHSLSFSRTVLGDWSDALGNAYLIHEDAKNNTFVDIY